MIGQDRPDTESSSSTKLLSPMKVFENDSCNLFHLEKYGSLHTSPKPPVMARPPPWTNKTRILPEKQGQVIKFEKRIYADYLFLYYQFSR